MPKPTLDESFRSGPPKRSPEEFHGWLTAEERRFILWGFKEHWSAARIGRALGVHEATVRRFRRGYWEDHSRLLELGLFEMIGPARGQEFRCLVCEERVQSKPKAERHVLEHFLGLPPEEIPEPEEEPEPRDDEDLFGWGECAKLRIRRRASGKRRRSGFP